MAEIALGDTSMLECPRCRGTWVDAATFEHICASHEAQAAVVHHPAPEPSQTTTEFRYRPCLACGTMMNRLNFGRLSGTVVDVCRGHGTFLDAGELHAIVRFIQGGGLDRADSARSRFSRSRNARSAPHRPPAQLGSDQQSGVTTVDSRALLAFLEHLRG